MVKESLKSVNSPSAPPIHRSQAIDTMLEHSQQNPFLRLSTSWRSDAMHAKNTQSLRRLPQIGIEIGKILLETNPSRERGGFFEQHIVGFHTAA